jgi:hypothetical protein
LEAFTICLYPLKLTCQLAIARIDKIADLLSPLHAHWLTTAHLKSRDDQATKTIDSAFIALDGGDLLVLSPDSPTTGTSQMTFS